ncbi:transposase [Xanthomonas oryzae pv. oryzae]|uniref:IS110 family transposase n=1 Tax=Xanthomonas oryzae TaxID=347 RepID=UPI003D711240
MDLAIELGNGKYRMKAKLSNDPTGCAALYAWLCTHAQPDSWVVMEATGIYHQALAEFLYPHGYRVCVLNPAQVALDARSQLQRGKTDRSDAKLIASYISRTGSARLRAGLYMPALVAMRHHPVVTALKQPLHARGKHGKQIVCAAMRKLLHLAYGVLKSSTAFDPQKALAT